MAPDPEMIKNYMMRGALTGPAAEEKEPMRYCKGKKSDGKRCKIVILGGKEFCREHQKDFDAGNDPTWTASVKAAMPVEAPKVSLHFAVFGMQDHACGVPVTEGTQSTTDWVDVTCAYCLVWKPETSTCADSQTDLSSMDVVAVGMDDRSEPDEKTGSPVEPDLVAGAGKLIEDESCKWALPLMEGSACMTACGETIHPNYFYGPSVCPFCNNTVEREIASAASTPSQEQTQVAAGERTALARLLPWVQPSIPFSSIVLDFDVYQLAAIQESELTTEELKEVILLLIAGELGRIVQVEDPLAKSRVRP